MRYVSEVPVRERKGRRETGSLQTGESVQSGRTSVPDRRQIKTDTGDGRCRSGLCNGRRVGNGERERIGLSIELADDCCGRKLTAICTNDGDCISLRVCRHARDDRYCTEREK